MKDISEYDFRDSNSDLGVFPIKSTFEINKNIFINENNLQNININHLFLSPSNISINGVPEKRISPEWFDFYQVYVDNELVFQGDRQVSQHSLSPTGVLEFGEAIGDTIYAKYRHSSVGQAWAMFGALNNPFKITIDPDPGSIFELSRAKQIFWDTREVTGNKAIDEIFSFSITHKVHEDEIPTFTWYSISDVEVKTFTFKKNVPNMTYYEESIEDLIENNKVFNSNSFRLFIEITPNQKYKILEKKSVFANVPAVGEKINYNRRVEVWTWDGEERTQTIDGEFINYITTLKWKREILIDETISRTYPTQDKANINVVSYLKYFNQQTFKEDYNAI